MKDHISSLPGSMEEGLVVLVFKVNKSSQLTFFDSKPYIRQGPSTLPMDIDVMKERIINEYLEQNKNI